VEKSVGQHLIQHYESFAIFSSPNNDNQQLILHQLMKHIIILQMQFYYKINKVCFHNLITTVYLSAHGCDWNLTVNSHNTSEMVNSEPETLG